ncbi:MAG: LysR family transcriptional regulator [Dehalococcoidia bacterium]
MELRELKSFQTTARLGSMTKAAEQLGHSQPTVSIHIKNLEEELGLVLFDRVKRPIQLTSKGAALSELTLPLLEGLDRLTARIPAAEEKAPVRVASTLDIIPHNLLRVARTFMSLYPNSRLRIRSGTRKEVLQMVTEGEVDIGIVPGPERSMALEFQGLFGYELVLITPLGHPLLKAPPGSLDEIAEWPLILMSPGTYVRTTLEEEFRRRGLSYEIVVELDSMDMIKGYVALGLGVAIGPRLALDPQDSDELGIVSVTHLLPSEMAGIVTLRRKTLSTPVLNYISVMRNIFVPSASNSNEESDGGVFVRDAPPVS